MLTSKKTEGEQAQTGELRVSWAPRTPVLARLERRIDVPSRWLLLVVGTWILWSTRERGLAGPWLWIMSGYAFLAIATTVFWFKRQPDGTDAASDQVARFGPWLAYASFLADALFISALIWQHGGMGSPLYLLLIALALKAVVLAPVLPGIIWMLFALGPLYVLALWLAAGNLGFLADGTFLGRYLLLGAWLVGMVLVAWELRRRASEAVSLRDALLQQQVALAQKTEVLQRTATDLGDRVLELRSLQEVAKALASTLRLEETLQLIAERLRSVTGSSHCAVALPDTEGEPLLIPSASSLNVTLASDEVAASESHHAAGQRTFRLTLSAEPPTLEALQSERVVRVRSSEGSDTPLLHLLGDHDYLITPLISRGRAIGALYLVEGNSSGSEAGLAPSGSKIDQLVSSFAYFASTAIENARLYQDSWEKRRELEAVLAGIGDGVVVVDPEFHLILMNPVARDILGLEVEPPAGVPLGPYLSTTAFADLLTETLRTERELIRELELPKLAMNETSPPGAMHTYGALASPVLNADGQVSGVVAVLRDITAQKELERMKSNFLSVVSHELRTPLHSIKGFVEIILMGKTGPMTDIQEDFLRTVRSQTTVLQRMIDDLLEFSRMEAGRVKLHLDEVSLPVIASSVAAKLAPLAQEGGLQLFMDMPEDLPEIDGDRMRLEQVLTNLVENAIKFTPSGGWVRLSAQVLDNRVRLTVSDTGIGILPEEQEKVFDRFYQVDGSERRAYRGAGLGLSICKHIVERHCGRIWVESDGIAGHGSQFHVELPRELRVVEVPTIDFTTPGGS